jgi:hypothetical protein
MMYPRILLVGVVLALTIFTFVAPIIPASTVYVEHCKWYATRWDSIGYALLGIGASHWDKLCQ